MDTEEDRQLVLVTTVDIGGGRTDQIELYVGDRPEVSHSISPAQGAQPFLLLGSDIRSHTGASSPY